MAFSWAVMVASSAGVSSSRARGATQLTCSAVRDMVPPRTRLGLNRRHLERLPLRRPLDQAAADRTDRDADGLDLPIDLDLDPLQVRLEPPLGLAGDLLADA